MKSLFLSLFLCFSFLSTTPPESGGAQCRMRALDARELTLQADLIARVRVKKVTEKKINPSYRQLAVLEVIDTLKGDPRGKEITVWAKSQVYCATDAYVRGQEFLVFLKFEQTYYRTLNYQYGQFLMGTNEMVPGWRTPGVPPQEWREKPYQEVRNEVLDYLEAIRPPETQTPTNGQPVPQKP